MSKIEVFIHDLLKQKGLTRIDRGELEEELLDHINSLKEEYIKEGYSNSEAEELAIKKFGENDFITDSIKQNLTSNNKYEELDFYEYINIMIIMFLSYFIASVILVRATELNYLSITFNTIKIIAPLLTATIIVSFKVNKNGNRIEAMIYTSIMFFMTERALVSIIALFNIQRVSDYNLLDIRYILLFLIITTILTAIVATLPNDLFESLKNRYNLTLKQTIAIFISTVLILMYYLFPNKLYILNQAVSNILNITIETVNKNILFLTINNAYFIPNIGLLIVISLLISTLIKRKIINKA